MTIFEYLNAKYGDSPTRILTGVEAHYFGVPFPLKSGWLDKHGATVITPEVAQELCYRLQAKGQNSGNAKKAKYCLLGASILRKITQ